ncbi:hypothetical protein ALP78_00868 [Pseudomonas coronafaciens pv. striafaciens]|uniref:Uncharacterized protein n=1 Tax=Pseudomonas coronafaciens pv. striafaciens TaxID=235276 RepID=A0A3M4YKA7_9PSED|nr:hypothetical protein ALP78_00868 [Pseudomonas coronafaciens pv. striafaciens]
MTLLVLLRDRHMRACRDSKGRKCREGSCKLQVESCKQGSSCKLQVESYKQGSSCKLQVESYKQGSSCKLQVESCK